ncbi:MAG TPA: RHS repeat-associated core domain-containing protein, partial [Acidimicrobiales bacterium]
SYSNEKNRTSTLPSSGTSDAYTYNPANELTGVVPSSGSFSSYVDDGNGLLQGETTASTTTNYTWSVQPSLPLMLSDGTDYYIYGPDDNPIEQVAVSGGTTSYLLADELGSIRAITNSSGTTTGTFSYDAWGNETGSTGSATTPFGFAGEYLDSASGLYYMRARWYDPVTGSFTSDDPAVSTTLQPFGYAANNPVNSTDPSGKCVAPAGYGCGYVVVDPSGGVAPTSVYEDAFNLVGEPLVNLLQSYDHLGYYETLIVDAESAGCPQAADGQCYGPLWSGPFGLGQLDLDNRNTWLSGQQWTLNPWLQIWAMRQYIAVVYGNAQEAWTKRESRCGSTLGCWY